MSQVKIVAAPAETDIRLSFLLAEDRLGHYPEFREFFVRKFGLDDAGRDRPGYVQAPSGLLMRSYSSYVGGSRFPAAWRYSRTWIVSNPWSMGPRIATCGPFSVG